MKAFVAGSAVLLCVVAATGAETVHPEVRPRQSYVVVASQATADAER